MASAVGRASGRSSVTMRALLVGSASGILLAACFLPLLWPLVGLATGGRGVHLGLVADPTLWSLLARTLAVTAGVLALALGIGLPMAVLVARTDVIRSEEHTSELQSLMRISYAVFCLKKTKRNEPEICNHLIVKRVATSYVTI